MTQTSALLPTDSTPFERGFSDAIARVSDIPIPVDTLWDPHLCPIGLLPWLAWSLSIDRWDADWSDDNKRAQVARAIAEQRLKGTRSAVDTVLASFDALATIVEWFDASPPLDPYTFEIRLPVIGLDGIAGGQRMAASTMRAIVREVSRAKPVRAHFMLIQQLTIDALAGPIMAAQATSFRRIDLQAQVNEAGNPWATFIQDENGEPLADDNGNFIDGSAV